MNKRIKAKWVAALKSGKYKRAIGTLAKNKAGKFSFCCLGVLCDLYAKEKRIKKPWVKSPDHTSICLFHGDKSETGLLPAKVKNWAALDGENPIVIAKKKDGYGKIMMGPVSLASLNDDHDKSFKTIATIIDKNL